MKIHYTGQQGGPYGWGVFGQNMVRELQRLGVYADDPKDADAIFHVLSNPNLKPFSDVRGKVNLGMAFFESELGPEAVENAKLLDCVFVGSTWCQRQCEALGIHNTEVLIQGVDRSVFKPGERKKDGQFRIFSGGKFEYRKGQDLVISAFREFAKTHPEAHLVCSWFNPWPKLIENASRAGQMGASLYWPRGEQHISDQFEFFGSLLYGNGIKESQFTVLPQLSHADLAREMANTDCGLFPNRCEGGTNLVLMEYAACGGAVIANGKTGHLDVENLIHTAIESKTDKAGWADQSVNDIVGALEFHLQLRTNGPRTIPTWESAAQKVLQAADRTLCVS